MYYYEYGVDQDLPEAFKWYLQAAENGNMNAQYNVGICYEYGKGVEIDLDKAIEWYTKAADLGHEKAKKALEELQSQNSGESPSVQNSGTGLRSVNRAA